jgi:hypothetical protein
MGIFCEPTRWQTQYLSLILGACVPLPTEEYISKRTEACAGKVQTGQIPSLGPK